MKFDKKRAISKSMKIAHFKFRWRCRESNSGPEKA